MIKGNSINSLTYQALYKLNKEGKELVSRAGNTRELLNEDLVLLDPRSRHLALKGRTSNIFHTIGETIWVLGGNDGSLDPLMKFILPKCINYSDDGGNTWSDAYNYRLNYRDQMDGLISTFLREKSNSRKACIALWMPELDCKSSLKDRGLPVSSAVPCNCMLFFYIRDNKLNLKVVQRSSDIIYGYSAINGFEFSLILEIMLEVLKNQDVTDEFKNLELGSQIQSVISLHYYTEFEPQVLKIIEENENLIDERDFPNLRVKLPKGCKLWTEVRIFFNSIYRYFCSMISGTEVSDFNTVEDIFTRFRCETYHNILFVYCLLLESYIKHKKHGEPFDFELLEPPCPNDLKQAVEMNKFINKKEKNNDCEEKRN